MSNKCEKLLFKSDIIEIEYEYNMDIILLLINNYLL